MQNEYQSPFLTLLDPQVKIKGSRDPLGFQPIWIRFGREIVGNLTTVTTSVRQFTTLILGFYFVRMAILKGMISEEEFINSFLKFEQLAAYSRYTFNFKKLEGDEDDDFIRGIMKVKKNFGEGGGKVYISADNKHQILSDQKTYGLWGLYRISSINSGLLEKEEFSLSPDTIKFVEEQVLNLMTKFGDRDVKHITEFLKYDQEFDLKGKHKNLASFLAQLHSQDFSNNEIDFYAKHLVYGEHSINDGRQKRLWTLIKKINERQFGSSSWDNTFNMIELRELIKESRLAGDEALTNALIDIFRLEQVLAPSAQLFGYLLKWDGQSVSSIINNIKSQWPSGCFDHLDIETFSRLMHMINEVSIAGTGVRLKNIALALHHGDYENALILLLHQNEEIMKSRGGGAWITLKGKILDVRFHNEIAELSNSDELHNLWYHGYFINSIKTIGKTLFIG